MTRVLLTAICASGTLAAASYKAGVAALVITPEKPIYMSGYANRNHPSEGKVQDLKAKALVIQDSKGVKVAIVTTDLIGLPRVLTDVVAARVQKTYEIDRAHLMLNSSHTHTGPLIAHNLEMMFELKPEEREVVDDYSRKLADDLVTVIGAAIQDLKPADLSFGNGQAHFAMNRRQETPNGIRLGVNPGGPTDPDVPVLKVTGPDGKLRAILFGYACHNTTLGGDFYKITGDYAGYSQDNIERANPGVTAMFVQLCGADQNPNPRGKLEFSEQHGRELADEVLRVAKQKLTRVRGPIRAAFQTTELRFAYRTRGDFEARLNDKNVWRARHARAMLKDYDENRPVRSYPAYPVQAIAFGKDLTVIALGGEVVVDYDLRLKREYGTKGMMIAGYSNDVMSYIPSQRMLKEGGYEVDDSMIYYGQPGRYAEDVEDRVVAAVHQVMKRVGR